MFAFQKYSLTVLTIRFFKNIFSERGERKKNERERQTLMWEKKHWLPLVCSPTGDWTCNLGTCPDGELTWRPFLHWTTPNGVMLARTGCQLFISLWPWSFPLMFIIACEFIMFYSWTLFFLAEEIALHCPYWNLLPFILITSPLNVISILIFQHDQPIGFILSVLFKSVMQVLKKNMEVETMP